MWWLHNKESANPRILVFLHDEKGHDRPNWYCPLIFIPSFNIIDLENKQVQRLHRTDCCYPLFFLIFIAKGGKPTDQSSLKDPILAQCFISAHSLSESKGGNPHNKDMMIACISLIKWNLGCFHLQNILNETNKYQSFCF